MLQFKVRSHYSYSRSREETNTLRKLCSPETGQVPIHQLTSAQPANRMDSKTKWFVFGLLSFALGSMFLAGYFLTPGYKFEDNTVAHICKHNKQVLKHNTIFLKHNTKLSKHNTILSKHNTILFRNAKRF